MTRDKLPNRRGDAEIVAAAHTRAGSIYFSASKTLIDQMSINEFADLDGSAEMVLVSDPCGLEDDYDLFDEDVVDARPRGGAGAGDHGDGRVG